MKNIFRTPSNKPGEKSTTDRLIAPPLLRPAPKRLHSELSKNLFEQGGVGKLDATGAFAKSHLGDKWFEVVPAPGTTSSVSSSLNRKILGGDLERGSRDENVVNPNIIDSKIQHNNGAVVPTIILSNCSDSD